MFLSRPIKIIPLCMASHSFYICHILSLLLFIMTVQRSLIFLILSVLSVSVESFAVRCPSSAFLTTSSVVSPAVARTTCLFAEEDNGTDAPPPTESDDNVESGEAAPAGNADTDILSSPAFLKRKVEVLKSDIAATAKDIEEAQARIEAGKAEWGSQLDDLRVEYKNIQERMAVQTQSKDMEVIRSAVRAMLELLDNFDRAFTSIKPETDAEKVIEAEYKEVYQQVMATIGELGVEEVPTVGIEFDYEMHQAVMQKPSDEYEEGIVCEEFQKGFKLGETLIRAAMVAVAA